MISRTGIRQLVLTDLPQVRAVSTGAAAAAELASFPTFRIVVLVEAPSVPLDLDRAGLEDQLVASGTFLDSPVSHAEGAGAFRTDDVAILLPLLPGARAAFFDAGGGASLASANFEAPPGTIRSLLPFIILICRFVM